MTKHPPIPYKCPVCDGSKKVSRPPWVAGDQPTWYGDSLQVYDCQACEGAGIIWYNLEKENENES